MTAATLGDHKESMLRLTPLGKLGGDADLMGPALLLASDAGGHITDWNARAEQMFGWTHRESLGQKLVETIIPPQYREAHRQGMEHFLATGQGPALNRVIELSALRRDEETSR